MIRVTRRERTDFVWLAVSLAVVLVLLLAPVARYSPWWWVGTAWIAIEGGRWLWQKFARRETRA